MSEIVVSGIDGNSVKTSLQKLILENQPKALGMATAFLTLDGARTYDALYKKCEGKMSRVVAGLSGAITQPAAIKFLAENGHVVRLGTHNVGIFHPKILVGGDRFLKSGRLATTNCGYVGSANFTGAGLTKNLELSLATEDPLLAERLGDAFTKIWTIGKKLTAASLELYEEAFARSQRSRSIEDLKFLEVIDVSKALKPRSASPLIAPRLCNGVWAGLQSFTGEHAFQVEFPKKAGEALGALLGIAEGQAPIECSDGETRTMTFRYYTHNGMYRLNVPNEMPLVSWAREEKRGALVVWRDRDSAEGHIHAEIVRGRRLQETLARSKALGTWGRTTTREYGWY